MTIMEWTKKLGRKVWIWVYICKAPAVGTDYPGIPCVSPRTIGEYYGRVKPYIFGAFNETSAVDRWLYNMLGYYVFSRICWNTSVRFRTLHRSMPASGSSNTDRTAFRARTVAISIRFSSPPDRLAFTSRST